MDFVLRAVWNFYTSSSHPVVVRRGGGKLKQKHGGRGKYISPGARKS